LLDDAHSSVSALLEARDQRLKHPLERLIAFMG